MPRLFIPGEGFIVMSIGLDEKISMRLGYMVVDV